MVCGLLFPELFCFGLGLLGSAGWWFWRLVFFLSLCFSALVFRFLRRLVGGFGGSRSSFSYVLWFWYTAPGPPPKKTINFFWPIFLIIYFLTTGSINFADANFIIFFFVTLTTNFRRHIYFSFSN